MQQKYKSKTLLQDTLVRHLFLLNMEKPILCKRIKSKFFIKKTKISETHKYIYVYIHW